MALTDETVTRGPSEQIVAMFETYERARDARNRLREMGIPERDIHILDRNAAPGDTTLTYERTDEGFWGALKRLFVPESEAPTYTEGWRRGYAMLAVTPPPGSRDTVISTLESFDPIDLGEREEEWRAAGWTGVPARMESAGVAGHGELGRSGVDRPAVEPTAARPSVAETAELRNAELGTTATPSTPATPRTTTTPSTAATTATTARTGESEAIPIVQEELAVGKRQVERGKVRVRSFVVERPIEEDVTLREERVDVERRPVDRPVGTLPEDAFREREIEVTARGEEPVVSKEARVVEEVVVHKDEDTRTERVRDTVRRTDVEVEDDRTTGRVATPSPTTTPKTPKAP
jgi:uncharacterized protein (TIGR02271 family)